jgi:predicted Zn finger-like uncharacterized protein
MILSCPKCETQYFADDSTIGESGRTVKCAACEHSWYVQPKNAQKAPEPASPPAHEVYLGRVREQRRRQSRFAAMMSWLVMAMMFFSLGLGSMLLRNDVVKVWPQSAGVYKRLGFAVNRYGLEFENIERSRTFDDTIPIITVSGQARNVARTLIETPHVRVTLKDEAGKAVGETEGVITPAKLKPGERGTFEIVIAPAPVDSFEIELSFADLKAGGPVKPAKTPVPTSAAEAPSLPPPPAAVENPLAAPPAPLPGAETGNPATP